jgi:hypothetical protein
LLPVAETIAQRVHSALEWIDFGVTSNGLLFFDVDGKKRQIVAGGK